MNAASHTPMAGQQVIIDFAQVGTAGPFPVVNGHVKLPGTTMLDLARMLRPTYEAAPGVGNGGFDHQTAADFLNGKTVSDESVRKFVHASRLAHDERAALSATLLSVRGDLASREAEIALLKKALLEAEAAPQQEAPKAAPGEPCRTCNGTHYTTLTAWSGRELCSDCGGSTQAAPQPAPAPLSDPRITAIEQAIRDYHYALDNREHGWSAACKAFDSIQSALNMEWEQGKESNRRAALAAQGGKA